MNDRAIRRLNHADLNNISVLYNVILDVMFFGSFLNNFRLDFISLFSAFF